MNLHLAKCKITILSALILLFSFTSCVRSQSNHVYNSDPTKPDSIDVNIGYKPGHYIKGRVPLQKGDCLYILTEQTGEDEPREERKEDSFYCPLYLDSVYSRYTSDLSAIARIWPMLDSVNASMMRALIIRDDTVFARQYLFKQHFEMPKNPIPLTRLITGLKKMNIREYRFKDRETARAEFRRLAFAPNVVMKGDTSWLHGDYGTFYIEVHSASIAREYISRIKEKFPNDLYDAYYHEQWGLIGINCNKEFYDKVDLYPKFEFLRPKRFSFVIYKKMED
jgi:hypothetical protein